MSRIVCSVALVSAVILGVSVLRPTTSFGQAPAAMGRLSVDAALLSLQNGARVGPAVVETAPSTTGVLFQGTQSSSPLAFNGPTAVTISNLGDCTIVIGSNLIANDVVLPPGVSAGRWISNFNSTNDVITWAARADGAVARFVWAIK